MYRSSSGIDVRLAVCWGVKFQDIPELLTEI